MKPLFAVVPLTALAVVGGGVAGWSYIGVGSEPSIVRKGAAPAERTFDEAMECLIKKQRSAGEAKLTPQTLSGMCSREAEAYAAASKRSRAVVDQGMIAFATRLLKR